MIFTPIPIIIQYNFTSKEQKSKEFILILGFYIKKIVKYLYRLHIEVILLKIYDISREIFSSKVYMDDPKPRVELLQRLSLADDYNLSAFYMNSHTATHVDAPLHFIEDSKSVDKLDLSLFFGTCTVITVDGILTGSDMESIVKACSSRILLKGKSQAFLSQSAAFVLADAKIKLVGTDAMSISTEDEEETVHKELLINGIPIIEGLDLENVADGNYILSAFPLKLGGLEASPIRAVLIDKSL